MRPTPRLYATVKSATRYLEPGTPTGLTGLPTHPSPRAALLYTYNKTLSKLRQLPSNSVYRQSTEALTKHRLSIIEAVKPPGHEEWLQRVRKAVESNPGAYKRYQKDDGTFAHQELEESTLETWDGKVEKKDARTEGSNTQTEVEAKGAYVKKDVETVDREAAEGVLETFRDLEIEPSLTADQISEVETKIAAGLIEEVVAVAEGELELVDEMLAARAWEDLEEQAPPGQWEYFERGDRV